MDIAALEPGEALLPFVVGSVDAGKMKLTAALLRDPNPIHWDVAAVRAAGLGDRVVNQGPATISYVLNMVAAWAGGVQTLRSVSIRLISNVFAGDRVECSGTVREIDQATRLVTVDVEARVGERVVAAGTVAVEAAPC